MMNTRHRDTMTESGEMHISNFLLGIIDTVIPGGHDRSVIASSSPARVAGRGRGRQHHSRAAFFLITERKIPAARSGPAAVHAI